MYLQLIHPVPAVSICEIIIQKLKDLSISVRTIAYSDNKAVLFLLMPNPIRYFISFDVETDKGLLIPHDTQVHYETTSSPCSQRYPQLECAGRVQNRPHSTRSLRQNPLARPRTDYQRSHHFCVSGGDSRQEVKSRLAWTLLAIGALEDHPVLLSSTVYLNYQRCLTVSTVKATTIPTPS